jgi:hypothetical protein
MSSLLDLTMLTCATIGAMAFSVLTAYAILRIGFAMMRGQRRTKVIEPQPEAAHTL